MANVKKELMWTHILINFRRTALNLEFVPDSMLPYMCDPGQGT